MIVVVLQCRVDLSTLNFFASQSATKNCQGFIETLSSEIVSLTTPEKRKMQIAIANRKNANMQKAYK